MSAYHPVFILDMTAVISVEIPKAPTDVAATLDMSCNMMGKHA